MNQEEFKKKIIPLQSAMQTLAERLLGDVADAEDMVQDVFITLWNKRNELDRVIRLESYCLQSVRTRCIDMIRKRKIDEKRIEEIAAITDEEVFDEVEETERRSEMLHSLLRQLPEKQRKIIEMKYFENCDTKQMETTLNMTSANVYTTLSRTLQTLREKLEKIL